MMEMRFFFISMGQFLRQPPNQLQLSSCAELQDCRQALFADVTGTKCRVVWESFVYIWL